MTSAQRNVGCYSYSSIEERVTLIYYMNQTPDQIRSVRSKTHKCDWCGTVTLIPMWELNEAKEGYRVHEFCTKKCRLMWIFQYRGKTINDLLVEFVRRQ